MSAISRAKASRLRVARVIDAKRDLSEGWSGAGPSYYFTGHANKDINKDRAWRRGNAERSQEATLEYNTRVRRGSRVMDVGLDCVTDAALDGGYRGPLMATRIYALSGQRIAGIEQKPTNRRILDAEAADDSGMLS